MSHTPNENGHGDTPRSRGCRECARLWSATRRERDRAWANEGTSARAAERDRQSRGSRGPRSDPARASVDVLALGGRTVVRIGRHTFGGVERFAVDDVIAVAGIALPVVALRDVLIARVPRAESIRNRAVARDRTWDAGSRASDVRACRHKRGHVARHSHGAPSIPPGMRRTIDALACTMFGHDPARAALDHSTMGECFAALAAPGYVMRESFTVRAERVMRERREHVEGTFAWEPDERGIARRVRVTDSCADCRNGERNTSWTATVSRDVVAPMPANARVRRANARLAVERTRTPEAIERDTRERTRDVAALDSRTWAREYAGVIA